MKYQNIFLVIFVGLLFPLVCSANMAMGFFVNYAPGLIVLLFLGICVIETEIIRKYLQIAKKRAFLVIFFVNLITSIIGLAVGRAVYGQIGGDWLFHIFGAAFVLSFLIESVLLRLALKETSWSQFFKIGFIMNLASYAFIVVFTILDMFVVAAPILAFFFIYKLFSFLIPAKNFKRVIFIIISAILAAGLAIFVSSQIPQGNSKARDSRIMAAISRARTVMDSIQANNGNYDTFDCMQEDMTYLCQEIKNNYGDGEFDVPNIAKIMDGVCIYSPLNKTEEKSLGFKKIYFWYCADSKGYAGRTSIDPGGHGYCVDGQSTVCPPVED